ncbi:ferredoxin reductase family protein [Paludibacterium purpuratum]|uniref:Putative ferric reductase n=1 Tax=Paludibacterium purpuratum TaxID=1144873 RepID=A0A4R7BDF7_9NEIS|nr:ferric reductase-like transmembrane domain-containing protein [Paludibacterium purpuratum]TDR82971.1 putative ferric reductase [Paludibacterium purpuratum]
MQKHPLTLLLALSTVLFAWASYAQYGWPADYWQWRQQLILLSGVQLMTVMGAAMLLATRSPWLESLLGGLDKMYRLHKRLGIASGVLLATHWLIKLSPPLFIALGVEPMLRHGGHHGGFSLAGLAREIGSWSAYLMLALVLLALLRRLPYGIFRKLHTLFAPLFLLGAFHGAVLMPAAFWPTPIGALFALTILAGTLAAIWVLTGRLGRARRHAGLVQSVVTLPGGMVEVSCQMGQDWPGHRAGQFARVTFDAAEGAHPFSIACGENSQGHLRFIIKGLGDYTGRLAETLRTGMPVTVEGPYGRFLPGRPEQSQAWVAAGIGVTPFLAWLETFAQRGGMLDRVDFYYCVPAAEQAVHLAELRRQCAATGARLHLIDSAHGERLQPAMLPAVEAVWFCGPAAMGTALAEGLIHRDGRKPRFHAEAFVMR